MEKKNKKATDPVIADELKKLGAIQSIIKLEGTQIIINQTREAIINSINLLANDYLDKQDMEIRALAATLKANLEIYRLITGATSQMEAIEKVLEEMPTDGS